MDSTRGQAGSLTPSQQRAVAARGNVLVMAGAGTGKTKTLVERCLHCLEHDGASVDELLVVTFTEAAAAEMRERLRHAMEERLALLAAALAEAGAGRPAGPAGVVNPAGPGGTAFWAEQLARFDLASIGTLHGFCLQLVRAHFYELGLDPRLAMLGDGEARQMANETLDEQFAAHYAQADDFSLATQKLIQTHGGGRDDAIRALILQLHDYAQARPDAAGWLARERQKFAAAHPADWRRWLPEAIGGWRDDWLPWLEELKAGNVKAAELAALLAQLGQPMPDEAWRQTAADILGQTVAADGSWPVSKKILLRTPIEGIFGEAQFLHSLAAVRTVDPLVEDWSWVHDQMETLLRLAEEFGDKLAERKRTNGVLDFHDLEQFALQLLWNFATGQPTAIAAAWRAKLKFVFVDEYQDINAAQDKIIQGLSGEAAAANRFLVGDVKQSIYRFRLADPGIFRDYARDWRQRAGKTIPLADNFRSREGLLLLVNSLFRTVMQEAVGGVTYDAAAELRFGARPSRLELSTAKDAAPCAELLLRFKPGRAESRAENDPLAGLDETQCEARLVARRLQELMTARQLVFDSEQKRFRPVQWRDMAILLRSPRGSSEIFAKEFERAGVPLAVARGGFYESAEILDLLSLLQLLDNPLQDVPCIAVLRSPLVGLSLDELAAIRLTARDRHFWTALNRSVAEGVSALAPEPAVKVTRFLERFARWRKLARLVSLSQCLEEVLTETWYADWLRAQPRGAQRAANVSGLQQLAQQFDQFQRQGLYRFLKFIDAQQAAAAEPEVPAVATEDAVRLMSVHQSKGLEFPVVVLADLARQFNERDLRGEIIFDEALGLCPKVQPPQVGRRYPSLPHWLAQRRQKRELRGEELRLLYVAMTRARDHLILTASISEKHWEEKWRRPQPVTARKIAAARSAADWLALWFSNQAPPPEPVENKDGQDWLAVWFPGGGSRQPHLPGEVKGRLEQLRWQIMSDAEIGANPADPGSSSSSSSLSSSSSPPDYPAAALEQLRARLEWNYPFAAATRRKAKSSVTALRREAEELDDEAEPLAPGEAAPMEAHRMRAGARAHIGGAGQLNAAEIGAAHHKFLQHFALENAEDLTAEADRLAQENYLSPEERSALHLPTLAAFWHSELGRKILARRDAVRRELPFTARFSPQELTAITGAPADATLAPEHVMVQGVADLVVLLPAEIWLLDFKTDSVTAASLAEKVRIYSPQIELYARALEKIFARPVTLRALHFLSAGQTVAVE